MRILFALAIIAGCGSNLKLTRIDSSVQRPSNIAVYFTVDTTNGDPVPGLTAESFKIYEDGAPVSALESKQTILNPEAQVTHYTLLLVDMSGSVSSSGDVPVIVESARAFSERVQKFQKVGVSVFDGSANIQSIAGFSNSAPNLESLNSFKPRDPSTNLNGAVIEGIKVLHQQRSASPTPLALGTLVIFTDGTDRAHRIDRDKLFDALDNADVDVMVIGVGAEVDEGELKSIGRNGAIISKDRNQIAASFAKMADRIEGFSKRYYLLGYCSPARAGKHTVRIEANANGKSGSLEHEFDAKGFGPNCDPNRPPAFNIHRPRPVAVNL